MSSIADINTSENTLLGKTNIPGEPAITGETVVVPGKLKPTFNLGNGNAGLTGIFKPKNHTEANAAPKEKTFLSGLIDDTMTKIVLPEKTNSTSESLAEQAPTLKQTIKPSTTDQSDKTPLAKYVANTLNGLKQKYLQIGDLETCRQMFELIIEVNKKNSNPINPSTVHNLALALHRLGMTIDDNIDSVDLFENDKLALINKQHNQPFVNLRENHNLALQLYNDALIKYQEAVGLYESRKIEEPPSLRNNLGVCLNDLGDKNQAIAEFDKVEANSHSKNNKALILIEQNKLEDARQLLETIDPPNENTNNSLAMLNYANGEYEAAKAKFDQMADLFANNNSKVCELRTPNRVISQPIIFQSLYNQFEQTFGPKHIQTLRTCNNLCVELCLNSQFDEAIEQLTYLIEDTEIILGLEHPDTISVLNNLEKARERVPVIADYYFIIFQPNRLSSLITPPDDDNVYAKRNEKDSVFQTVAKEIEENYTPPTVPILELHKDLTLLSGLNFSGIGEDITKSIQNFAEYKNYVLRDNNAKKAHTTIDKQAIKDKRVLDEIFWNKIKVALFAYNSIIDTVKQHLKIYEKAKQETQENKLILLKKKVGQIQIIEFKTFLEHQIKLIEELVSKIDEIDKKFKEKNLLFSNNTSFLDINKQLLNIIDLLDVMVNNFLNKPSKSKLNEGDTEAFNISFKNSSGDSPIDFSPVKTTIEKYNRQNIDKLTEITNKLKEKTIKESEIKELLEQKELINKRLKETVKNKIVDVISRLLKYLTALVNKSYDFVTDPNFDEKAKEIKRKELGVKKIFENYQELDVKKSSNTFTVETKMTSDGNYIVSIIDNTGNPHIKQVDKNKIKPDAIKVVSDYKGDANDKLKKQCDTLTGSEEEKKKRLADKGIATDEVQMHIDICNKITEYNKSKAKNKGETSGGKTRKVRRRKKTKKLKRKTGRKFSTRK